MSNHAIGSFWRRWRGTRRARRRRRNCLWRNNPIYTLASEKYCEILMFNRVLMWLKVCCLIICVSRIFCHVRKYFLFLFIRSRVFAILLPLPNAWRRNGNASDVPRAAIPFEIYFLVCSTIFNFSNRIKLKSFFSCFLKKKLMLMLVESAARTELRLE